MFSILAGCGGSGSGGGSDDAPDDDGGGITEPNAFSIDSYTEYKEGDDLSGIWMMVVNTEYDVQTAQGTQRTAESFRSTVFIKETNSGSYSHLDVSNPFCGPMQPYLYVSYTGNTVELESDYASFDLAVIDYSRMSGTLNESRAYDCGLGDICIDNDDDNTETTVEMVKVAPLPIGNWYDNFVGGSPTIGNITGVVQSDATTDAFEFDDDVDCFTHSKGHGQRFNMALPFYEQSAVPDYESIVVSIKKGDDLIISKTDGVLQYLSFGTSEYYPGYLFPKFSQSTPNFEMSVDGSNPIVINISADASNDASSDGAELDIRIDI